MKTYLITGLDGCGKSTVFERVTKEGFEHVSILNVPHYDLSKFDKGDEVYPLLESVNAISYEADNRKSKVLKTIALFGSMLLFSDAATRVSTDKTKVLLCERHPLVDVKVYSAFYVEKSIQRISVDDWDFLIEKHAKLITYIRSRIQLSSGRTIVDLLEFIRNMFGKNQSEMNQLADLFNVSPPDKVYFLDADVEILLSRLSDRKIREPHEEHMAMSMMQNVYKMVFDELKRVYNIELKYIDVSTFDKLDRFFSDLKNEIE